MRLWLSIVALQSDTMKFPEQFLSHIRSNPGFNEAAFIAAHELPPSVSIRYNPHKVSAFSCAHAVPWSTYGCYLESRPVFALDPLFHAGAYYVQEASSMFLETILRSMGVDKSQKRILDLCAAPGGKSTLIAAMMHPDSVLFSNEVIKSRIPALKENLTKWGVANVVVTQNDAADFGKLDAFFDVIVVDAPCSGSGMFRKDPRAMDEWSVDHVAHCSKRQHRIVQDILPALKPGGWLVYATCSYSMEENEQVIAHLTETGWQTLDAVPSYPGVYASSVGYRFYPDQLNGEGFYIAALQKPITDNQVIYADVRDQSNKFTPVHAFPASWITPKSDIACFTWRNEVFGFPEAVQSILSYAQQLRIQQIGILIGEFKHSNLIPNHAFAMSTILHEKIPRIQVDRETAQQFLRKNTIQTETDLTGWALIEYQHVALGWIKMIPGRLNNYYPTEWRLRM